MKIATSYFYQIRNFKEWMIPVSTALSDPDWYRPEPGQEYFYDKRGIVCGLRYEPLIVQQESTHSCPCEDQLMGPLMNFKDIIKPPLCETMREYNYLLKTKVNKEKTLKAFEYCANKFQKEIGFKHEPIIVLIVYEAPTNPCSERWALQKYFNCKELRYPIC